MLTYISKDYLTNRNGIYYFQRRIPIDVRNHYNSHAIACSLKTRSRRIALRAASSLIRYCPNKTISLFQVWRYYEEAFTPVLFLLQLVNNIGGLSRPHNRVYNFDGRLSLVIHNEVLISLGE